MDFWEVIKVLVRRWVVVVPILALTAAAAVLLPPQIQPTYSASASAVVISPPNGQAVLNPYLALGPVTMAQAISLSADGATAKEQVKAAGNSASFSVSQQNSRSPIMVVDAEADSPAAVVATVEQVLEIISAQLAERQSAAGAQPGMQYTAQNLNAEISATPVYDGARRVRFMAVGLGFMVAVTLALGLEGLAVYRSRRGALPLEIPAEDRLANVGERLALLEEKERLLLERDILLQRRLQPAADGPSDDAPERPARPPRRKTAINGAASPMHVEPPASLPVPLNGLRGGRAAAHESREAPTKPMEERGRAAGAHRR